MRNVVLCEAASSTFCERKEIGFAVSKEGYFLKTSHCFVCANSQKISLVYDSV